MRSISNVSDTLSISPFLIYLYSRICPGGIATNADI
jgi:hypothetical protein